MARRLLLVVLCLLHVAWIQAGFQDKEKQILDSIMENYDTRIRPTPANSSTENGPTVVRVNMFIRHITHVDDKNMEYDVQVTLRQAWTDDRLKYDAGDIKYVTLNDKSRLWVPDLFFSNEMKSHEHDLVTPNMFFRIAPDGDVTYSTRLSLTLMCPMNLRMFPFDKQVCTMRMASYGYTTDDIVFLWKDESPVQVVKNLHIEKFNLDSFSTDYCNSKTITGEYSCLKIDLLLAREMNFYLIHLFIPSVMLAMLSWVVFWLDRKALSTRMLIGVAALLAMAVQSTMFNASLAAVSYARASDVWSGVVLTFMFLAILETATVHYLSRQEERRRGQQSAPSAETPATDEEALDLKPLVEQPEEVIPKEENGSPSKFRLKERASGLTARLAKIPTFSKKLDVISRILFPFGFLIFFSIFVIAQFVRE